MRVFLLLLLASSFAYADADLPLNKIKLPPRFKIEVLARVPNARAMSIVPSGNIFVGSRSEGKIYVVVRKNMKVQSVEVLAKGKNLPVGVAFHEGDLYFSEVSKIWKIPNVESNFKTPSAPVLVSDKFPSDGHHGWKYIAFGPDGKLYVPVGAPCNLCDKGPDYANIMRMNKDGSGLEVYAEGIRNTVGFDWHPRTKELWFTDNGRDWMGDEIPPCELNHAPKKGMHFGYPYCHGTALNDPEFGKGKDCGKYTPAAQNLGPHTAPLGMTFYTGKMFPAEYKDMVFIAEHGSWNRAKKNGYRVMTVPLKDGKASGYTSFAEGWLEKENTWGRPVDVKVDLDGALLISDDAGDAIYRVSYQ